MGRVQPIVILATSLGIIHLMCRLPLFALGNYADKENHKPGSKCEQTNPPNPVFGGSSDEPRKNAENPTDSQKPDHHLFV